MPCRLTHRLLACATSSSCHRLSHPPGDAPMDLPEPLRPLPCALDLLPLPWPLPAYSPCPSVNGRGQGVRAGRVCGGPLLHVPGARLLLACPCKRASALILLQQHALGAPFGGVCTFLFRQGHDRPFATAVACCKGCWLRCRGHEHVASVSLHHAGGRPQRQPCCACSRRVGVEDGAGHARPGGLAPRVRPCALARAEGRLGRTQAYPLGRAA